MVMRSAGVMWVRRWVGRWVPYQEPWSGGGRRSESLPRPPKLLLMPSSSPGTGEEPNCDDEGEKAEERGEAGRGGEGQRGREGGTG